MQDFILTRKTSVFRMILIFDVFRKFKQKLLMYSLCISFGVKIVLLQDIIEQLQLTDHYCEV